MPASNKSISLSIDPRKSWNNETYGRFNPRPDFRRFQSRKKRSTDSTILFRRDRFLTRRLGPLIERQLPEQFEQKSVGRLPFNPT